MKEAVLFDIDGTILDSHDFVFGAVRFALSKYGYPDPEAKFLKKAQGRPLSKFYEILLPLEQSGKFVEAHKEFQKANFHLVKSFPNVERTLQELRKSGFVMGAVSNRLRESLLISLQLAELLQYFDVVLGADDVVNPKPHQDHLLFALNKLQVTPQNSYMVGDTDHDILAGKNAGIKTVGVTYGWLGRKIAKYNPDYVINDIEELLQIIK